MKQELEKTQEVAKFQIGDLLPIGITILVLGIALAYGLQVMGDIKGDMTVNSTEANATQKGIEAVAKIPDRLPMIVTVILASVIIGIVVVYLAGRAMK